ncbi:MAG: UDP-N-acetylmuramate dehydrogenase [Paracoccaceae bacterium]
MSWVHPLPDVEGRLTPDRQMSGLSWLRVGGAADLLFQPAHIADISAFMRAIPDTTPVMPVGVCSNLIIRDGGIRGAVIRLGRGFNGFEVMTNGCLRVGAGALDAQVAKKAAAKGYDLAFLRTIPGAIGGAVRMNAGCYGSYLADVFVSATAVNRRGAVITLTREDMGFSYRHSNLPEDMVIVQVVLRAPRDDPSEIGVRMASAVAHRAETQPVDDLSCGSTFRNPAGFSSTGRADDVHDRKAWKVIDDAGLRGARLGGAQISPKHPNFLINAGGATAADLENLGEMVRKKVFQHSGISLEWEIRRVGEPAP